MAKEYFYKIITEPEKLSDRADEVDGALEPKVVKSYIKRVKTAMKQIKEEILNEVQREIQVQVDLLMNGKKIDNVDIGQVVCDEVLRQIKASI